MSCLMAQGSDAGVARSRDKYYTTKPLRSLGGEIVLKDISIFSSSGFCSAEQNS